MSDWISRLQDKLADRGDKIPPGWWTVEQEAKRIKKSKMTVRRLVNSALEAGIVEGKVFRINNGKRIFHVAHYHETK